MNAKGEAMAGRSPQPAPRLVRREWRDIKTMPTPDVRIEVPDGHVAVYVQRVSGAGFFDLVGQIVGLVVAPERRGCGIGSDLVKSALGWVRDHGIRFASLNCEREMVPFYGRFGFVEVTNLLGPGVSMVADLNEWHDRPRWPKDKGDLRRDAYCPPQVQEEKKP